MLIEFDSLPMKQQYIDLFFSPSQVDPRILLITPVGGRVDIPPYTVQRVSERVYEGVTNHGTPLSILINPQLGTVEEVRSV